MANYLFNKYNVTYGPWSGETVSYSSGGQGGGEVWGYSSSPTWNGSQYVGDGWGPKGVGSSYWSAGGGGAGSTQASKTYGSWSGQQDGTTYFYNYTDYTRTRSASPTTLAQAGIVGTINQYPINGLHHDGFYYIRTGIENSPIITAPNGGNDINELFTITFTDNKPTAGIRYHIQLTLNNGGSWKDIVALTPVGATSYVYNFVNETPTSTAKVRVRAYDGQNYGAWDESNGVFTIQHNIAPTTPTGLEPSGIVVDRTKTQRLAWRHNDSLNDTQSKANIEWRVQGATLWNAITSNGTEQSYFIAANTFPNGQIEWRVRTYDQSGLVSPWSGIAVFTVAEPSSAPTILQPSETVSIARPIIEWSSSSQASYQLVIEDSLGAIVWDTGEIVNTVKARTVGVDLLNGGIYTVKVRIKDGSGLFSTFASHTFTVSYTPPAKPIVQAFTGVGAIAITIDHDTPVDTQPTVTLSDVYKQVNGEWIRIATGIDKSFTDYAVASGVEYQYRIQSHGDNGTFTYSDVVSASVTLKGAWIHAVQDAEDTVRQFVYNGVGYDENIEPESAVMKYAGRTRPVIQYGIYEDYSLTVLLQEREGMGDMDALRSFVRGRETICYRDSDGRVLYGHIPTLNVTKEYRVSSASISIIETEFTEEV